jgi:hypothetical protein
MLSKYVSRRTLRIAAWVVIALALLDHVARVTDHPELRPIRPFRWLSQLFVMACEWAAYHACSWFVAFWSSAESIGLKIIELAAPWCTGLKDAWLWAWGLIKSFLGKLGDIFSVKQLLMSLAEWLSVPLNFVHGALVLVDWQRFIPEFKTPEWVANFAAFTRAVTQTVVGISSALAACALVARYTWALAAWGARKQLEAEEGETGVPPLPPAPNPVDVVCMKAWHLAKRCWRAGLRKLPCRCAARQKQK